MRLLLDTHIFLAVIEDRRDAIPSALLRTLNDDRAELFLSAASLWEIAIKSRLGKLPMTVALEELPETAASYAIAILAINEHHALRHVEPEPPTRDPFDRLLLAQCQIERMRLVTIDRALADHPLSATASQK